LQQANKFDLTREEVFELYDLEHDPGETTNLADTLPEQVDRLRKAYDHWLRDIRPERGFVDMPSWIGDDQENPVTLTHQDRRSTHLWGTEDFREEDYWPVRILNAGKYTAKIRFLHPATEKSTAVLRIGDQRFRQNILEGADTVVLPSIHLQRMESALLRAWVEQGEEKRAAYQVTIAHQE
jgi:hypothetical protein